MHHCPADAPQVVEVLYFTGCPNYQPLMHRVSGLLAEVGAHAVLTEREVSSDEAAETERFLGSPTVRVDGVDVEPGATDRHTFGLSCRLYRTTHGLRGAPPDEWILALLRIGRESDP